ARTLRKILTPLTLPLYTLTYYGKKNIKTLSPHQTISSESENMRCRHTPTSHQAVSYESERFTNIIAG
ncbi:MAG: hypothetical protein K2M98_08895, partial [Muribaculum sp.]|nr:hypothetical protein [Muribaculum sp.]